MANHGFVTSRKWFREGEIEEHLHDINQKRFKGLLKISKEEDASWTIEIGKLAYFSMWIENRNKLEFRHPYNFWMEWVMVVIQNILAHHYNGWISDEGLGEERWRGDPTKFQTYESFVDVFTEHVEDPVAKKIVRVGYMAWRPESIRGVLE